MEGNNKIVETAQIYLINVLFFFYLSFQWQGNLDTSYESLQ